ncbi:serine hydrolase domain-containing protein [Sediminicola sp. 1XM1-17]|uniref:serine hydrolase domain-containing protein n=1 Tax=Sediminicola sp. 1XM1-17 TaxID=3127702 RepID=UPI0030769669
MKTFFLVLIVSLFFLGCRTTPAHPKFQVILDKAVKKKSNNLSGVSMTVLAPTLNISWSGAAGYDSKEKTHKLSAEQPFRIASVTKTFVASAILRLQEEQKLKLEDSIAAYISEHHYQLLKSDGYDPDIITIKQCLQHRSGLFDYAEGNSSYIDSILKNPTKKWTRTQQLEFAMEAGDPLGLPGEVYGYSDTGYILLGEIIENSTGQNLAQALRELLKFDALGLKSTWMEGLEESPAGLLPPVHRYIGNYDATGLDNTIDLYGGGGLTSNTKDLAVFFDALFNGEIYKDSETLRIMLEDPGPLPYGAESEDYRMGLGQDGVLGITGYVHFGFWGTVWVHMPKPNYTIVVNFTNQPEAAGIVTSTTEMLQKLATSK